MTEITVKILVELLSTLALTTRQIKQGKTSKPVFGDVLHYLTQCISEKFAKKFFGDKDIEAILKRLDRLTQDEARNTAAQTLEVVYGLVQSMTVVMDGEQIHWPISAQSREKSYVDGKASVDGIRDALSMFCGPKSSDSVSNYVLETIQQVASDLNKSKRKLF